MRHLYTRAVQRSTALEQLLGIFAAAATTPALVESVLERVYVVPVEPADAERPDYERRHSDWETGVRSAERSRTAVRELFEGAGTGMNAAATEGTLYGLYNAIVEWEDYKPGGSEEASARGRIWGDRAAAKARAFDAIEQIARSR
jgi:hypothetical protein